MYHFEVLEIIKKAQAPISAMEIYVEMKASRSCNLLAIKGTLKKLYFKNPHVDRKFILVEGRTNGVRECRYFWID